MFDRDVSEPLLRALSQLCLGSLSCWNMTFQPSPRFLRALDQVFITLLTHLFLTLTFIPVPASEIHPPPHPLQHDAAPTYCAGDEWYVF